MDQEFGMSRCKLLYAEWINNKVLLHSKGNYIQYIVINYNIMESNLKYTYMYILITESLCCTPETNTIL